MSLQLDGTTGIQFNDGSDQSTAATPYGRKNLIINGDMRIAQRGTSATGLTTSGYNTVDRWTPRIGTAGTWTETQDTNVPSGQGFANSLKLQCTTANASLSAGSLMILQYRFEGQHLQHLKKGTSNAESVTLSFWVKSNKTGTYVVDLYDIDNTRTISKSYTIDTADTWEKKTLTYEGDTTGTLDNDNARSMDLNMWLAAGSDYSSGTLDTSWASVTQANRAAGQVNLADSTSNYINITGVQLEVGDAASDFEFMPYDMELQRCQRYYQQLGGNSTFENFGQGCSFSTTNTYIQIQLPTPMRANSSLEYSNLSHFRLHYPGVVGITPLTSIALVTDDLSPTMVVINVATTSTASAGGGKCLQLTAENSTSARIKLSAEL